MLTQSLVFYVGSGQAFFAGAICLLAAVCLSILASQTPALIARSSLVFLGGMLVFVSATPQPAWLYLLLLILSLAWFIVELTRDWFPDAVLLSLRAIVASAWVLAAFVELPYHRLPT